MVERHLLQGIQNIFNWVKINRIADESVIAIAAEDKETRDKRMTLKQKLVAIDDAARVCADLAARKEFRPSTPIVDTSVLEKPENIKNVRPLSPKVKSNPKESENFVSSTEDETESDEDSVRDFGRSQKMDPQFPSVTRSRFSTPIRTRQGSVHQDRSPSPTKTLNSTPNGGAVHNLASAFGSPIARNQQTALGKS